MSLETHLHGLIFHRQYQDYVLGLVGDRNSHLDETVSQTNVCETNVSVAITSGQCTVFNRRDVC
jgi:hypothetical protein